MKMSKKIMLTTVLTGSIFMLSGCLEESPKFENMSFSSTDSCIRGKPSDVKNDIESSEEWDMMCNTSYKEAVEAHEKEAPRYTGDDAKKLCEEQHGDGKCYSPADIAQTGTTSDETPSSVAGEAAATTASSSGNWFMPFMAGWMVSSLLDSGTRTYQSSLARPLYNASGGGYYNSNGYRYNNLNSTRTSRTSATTYTRTTPTTYNSRTVRSTGGFGASRTSSYSSSRSYGG